MEPETRLTLHDLAVRPDGDEVIVGRAEVGDFVALPAIGGEILDLVGKGSSIAEVHAHLLEAKGVDVDVGEFVEALLELGFVRAVDGRPVGEPLPDGEPARRERLSPQAAARMFSWPVKLVGAAASVATVVTWCRRPGLLPHTHDIVWASSTTVVLVTMTLLMVAVVALHESAHLAAARSYGVPAQIRLSTRLTDLVLQTRATGLWAFGRRERLRFYLAGMAADVILLSAMVLVRAYTGLPAPADRFLAASALVVVLQLVWQLALYTRTDLYLVLMDAMRCPNLFGDAMGYLRYKSPLTRARAAGDRADPLAALPERERPLVRRYAWFAAGGSVLSVGAAFLFGMPALVSLIVHTGRELAAGFGHDRPLEGLDALLTLAIEVASLGLFVVTFRRGRRARPRA
jgi:putative peptide zinc metalloprotease protein